VRLSFATPALYCNRLGPEKRARCVASLNSMWQPSSPISGVSQPINRNLTTGFHLGFQGTGSRFWIHNFDQASLGNLR
jgi:hypothetical protein